MFVCLELPTKSSRALQINDGFLFMSQNIFDWVIPIFCWRNWVESGVFLMESGFKGILGSRMLAVNMLSWWITHILLIWGDEALSMMPLATRPFCPIWQDLLELHLRLLEAVGLNRRILQLSFSDTTEKLSQVWKSQNPFRQFQIKVPYQVKH